jgi:hypothetical protein
MWFLHCEQAPQVDRAALRWPPLPLLLLWLPSLHSEVSAADVPTCYGEHDDPNKEAWAPRDPEEERVEEGGRYATRACSQRNARSPHAR